MPSRWQLRPNKGAGQSFTLKRPFWEIGDESGKGIAFVFGDTGANARLIAAAPELLDALQASSRILTRMVKEAWLRKIDEALQKAQPAQGKGAQG